MKSTKNRIIAELRIRGLTVSDFAREHKYNIYTTRRVIDRISDGYSINGIKSKEIMRSLEKELGHEISR